MNNNKKTDRNLKKSSRTRPIAKSEVPPTPAKPQPQLRSEMVTLEYLHKYRHMFDVSPSYQRQQVWPLRWSQMLIDSILLGDPIGRFEGHEVFNEKGEKKWDIDDGHQRITSIHRFMDGEFKTMTKPQKRQAEPGSVDEPVEPGKYFHELSITAQNTLLTYQMQIDRVRPMSYEQRVERFLRIQNQAPLSAAERLTVYNSKAKASATLIEEHPFWQTCYKGKTYRQQVYQTSLYLLALEMTDSNFLDLKSGPFVKMLASGVYDQTITDEIVNAVILRLDIVAHVYAGIEFTDRAIVIAMYQSIRFLEEMDYVFQIKDRGHLATWISNILAASKRAVGIPNYNQPVQILLYESGQRNFWDKHRHELMRLFGINKPNEAA